MSQTTAVTVTRPAVRPARPAARAGARAASPRLRVVSAPAQARSRAGVVVASLAVLAVGLVGLLLLNLSLERGAFERRTQQGLIQQLSEQRQALQEQIAAREAPQALAARAEALGMVESGGAAFVRASDGRVLGVPSPGVVKRSAMVTPGASAAQAGTTTSTKVTAAGKAAATTTATSAGKPASSAAGAKAPASTGAKSGARTGTASAGKTGTTTPRAAVSKPASGTSTTTTR